MTGYQSKKAAALDEEGMYLVHQTASYADNLGKSIVALGKQTVADIEQLGIQPAQEPVAWIQKDMQCDDFDPDSVTCEKPARAADGWEWIPLYTTPPQENNN